MAIFHTDDSLSDFYGHTATVRVNSPSYNKRPGGMGSLPTDQKVIENPLSIESDPVGLIRFGYFTINTDGFLGWWDSFGSTPDLQNKLKQVEKPCDDCDK